MRIHNTAAITATSVLLLAVTTVPASSKDEPPTLIDHIAANYTDLVSTEPGTSTTKTLEDYRTLVEEIFPESPERWGGAFMEGDTLVVNYVDQTHGAASSKLFLAGIDPETDLELRLADTSLLELQAAHDEFLESELTSLVAVGPQYSENRLAVGIDVDAGDHSFLAQSDLPDIEVEVAFYAAERGQSAQDLRPLMGGGEFEWDTRWHGPGPIRAGGAIFFIGDTAESRCSTGFPWINRDGERVLLSAAHCAFKPSVDDRLFTIRKSVPNAWDPVGPVVWSSGGHYGSVDGRRGDVAVIARDPYEPYGFEGSVWTGNGNTSTYRAVSEYTALPENWQGTNLRTSGASSFESDEETGEIAPDWISQVDQTLTYDSGAIWTGLSVAEHSTDCTVPGDSGGAYYLNASDGTAIAVGILSGHKSPSWPWQNCKNFFTPVTSVVADYGGGPLYGAD